MSQQCRIYEVNEIQPLQVSYAVRFVCLVVDLHQLSFTLQGAYYYLLQ